MHAVLNMNLILWEKGQIHYCYKGYGVPTVLVHQILCTDRVEIDLLMNKRWALSCFGLSKISSNIFCQVIFNFKASFFDIILDR